MQYPRMFQGTGTRTRHEKLAVVLTGKCYISGHPAPAEEHHHKQSVLGDDLHKGVPHFQFNRKRRWRAMRHHGGQVMGSPTEHATPVYIQYSTAQYSTIQYSTGSWREGEPAGAPVLSEHCSHSPCETLSQSRDSCMSAGRECGRREGKVGCLGGRPWAFWRQRPVALWKRKKCGPRDVQDQVWLGLDCSHHPTQQGGPLPSMPLSPSLCPLALPLLARLQARVHATQAEGAPGEPRLLGEELPSPRGVAFSHAQARLLCAKVAPLCVPGRLGLEAEGAGRASHGALEHESLPRLPHLHACGGGTPRRRKAGDNTAGGDVGLAKKALLGAGSLKISG